jgi:hypothetical protein
MQVVGFGWALLGAANIVMMISKRPESGIATFGLIFNVLLFVLPGLVVGALGSGLKKRSANAASEKAALEAGERERIKAAVAAALEEERRKPH